MKALGAAGFLPTPPSRSKQAYMACHSDGLRPCQAAQACLALYSYANMQSA